MGKMKKLSIPKPQSMGLILSYQCNIACRDCIYACSPQWKAAWMRKKDAKKIFSQLSPILSRAAPPGVNRIGFSYGLHFTGGEPFLQIGLLEEMTALAAEAGIPMPFVETNCFWATNDQKTERILGRLKKAGLKGILLSVNPFNIEHIPFERIQRAARVAQDLFGPNTIIYQPFYYQLFEKLNLSGTIQLEQLLDIINPQSMLGHTELLPMGRAAYTLQNFYQSYPADYFFQHNCLQELTRPWHIHIDHYQNYVPGFCSGLSLGKADNLSALFGGIDLGQRPVLEALTQSIESLYRLGTSLGYQPNSEGYVSKCHLCAHIRQYLVGSGKHFAELDPAPFYDHL